MSKIAKIAQISTRPLRAVFSSRVVPCASLAAFLALGAIGPSLARAGAAPGSNSEKSAQPAASKADLSGAVKGFDPKISEPAADPFAAANAQTAARKPMECSAGERKALVAYQFTKPNTGVNGFGSAFVCDRPDAFTTEEGLRKTQEAIEQNIGGAFDKAEGKKAKGAVNVVIMNVILLRK